MSKGMLTVGIILLSLISLLLINILNNYSTGSELDYYLVKEVTDAAMEDAIDYTYLRTCGLYRIDKERFAESLVLRFANSVDGTRDYTIRLYDINEVPPKVSVQINSDTVLSVRAKKTDANENYVGEETVAGDISTSYDAIMETKYLSDLGVEAGTKATNPGDPNYTQCLPLNQQ